MIKSMTGFCKTEINEGDLHCTVEIRSVNHRFLEARIHLPRQFQDLEEVLKRQLKSKISRGKVDVYIQMDNNNGEEEKLSVDLSVWKNVRSIIDILERDIGRDMQVNMSDLLQIKGLVAYEQEEKDDEEHQKLFKQAVEKGADELIEMRKREGQLLAKEILGHVEILQSLLDEVPAMRQEVVESNQARLKKNLENLRIKHDPDDPRIMQEIGIFLDRSDITEEVERFGSHLIQIRELLEAEIPVGRKLDFILQELYREANTLCSKANHIKITQMGVEMKCEIEKIREQVQNIE